MGWLHPQSLLYGYKLHTHLLHMRLLHQFLPISLEMGTVITSILHLRKLRHKKVAYLPYVSHHGENQNLNTVDLTAELSFYPTTLQGSQTQLPAGATQVPYVGKAGWE